MIVLTGKGNTANAVKSMEAGAFSYVEKLLEDDATVRAPDLQGGARIQTS